MQIPTIRIKTRTLLKPDSGHNELAALSRNISNNFRYVGAKVSPKKVLEQLTSCDGKEHRLCFAAVLDILHREFSGRILSLEDGNISQIGEISLEVMKKLPKTMRAHDSMTDAMFESYKTNSLNGKSFAGAIRNAITALHSDPEWLKNAKTYTPEIVVLDNANMVAERAAQIYADVVFSRPKVRILHSTGRTPLLTYQKIVETYHNSFSRRIDGYNLDEYIDIPPKFSESSYSYYLQTRLYWPLGVKGARFFNPASKTPALAARAYEKRLLNAPIDLAILGIGPYPDVHLAFRQAYSSFESAIGIVGMGADIRNKNASDFGGNPDNVVDFAYSVRLKTIRDFPMRILLLAIGADKRRSVEELLKGPTERVPASSLLLRPGVTILVDPAAAPR